MASMWHRAMVYLGLQDDDELDYGGDYESYAEYGETRDQRGRDETDPRGARASTSVRTERDVPSDYAVPDPPPRPSGREEPSGVSSPRPAVVRTIGPTTAARVHVVDPERFNDA